MCNPGFNRVLPSTGLPKRSSNPCSPGSMITTMVESSSASNCSKISHASAFSTNNR